MAPTFPAFANMHPPSKISPVEMIEELVTKLSLELSFVEPGTDSGLLPINSFLMDIEERLQPCAAPAHIVQAVRQARIWVDRIFDATAAFDNPTVTAFVEWSTWMGSALERWRNELPPPALPA